VWGLVLRSAMRPAGRATCQQNTDTNACHPPHGHYLSAWANRVYHFGGSKQRTKSRPASREPCTGGEGRQFLPLVGLRLKRNSGRPSGEVTRPPPAVTRTQPAAMSHSRALSDRVASSSPLATHASWRAVEPRLRQMKRSSQRCAIAATGPAGLEGMPRRAVRLVLPATARARCRPAPPTLNQQAVRATRRVENLARRIVDRAADRPAAPHGGHGAGVQWDTAQKVAGAIERVDDPAYAV